MKSINQAFQIFKCPWYFIFLFFISDLVHAIGVNFVYSEESPEITDFFKGFTQNHISRLSDFKKQRIDDIRSCENSFIHIAFGVDVASQLIKKCPAINLSVADSEYKITNFEMAMKRKYSAIFIDQSIAQQTKLIQKRVPHFDEIGILYQTEQERSIIVETERLTSISLSSQKIKQDENPGPYFRDLIKNVDGILITTNTNIWKKKDIRGFLLYSLRQGKVILGGPTKDYVKAGVFAGVYTDMEKLGEKASSAIIGRHQPRLRMHPDDGIFIYNRFLASRLSIQVIEE